MELNEIKNPNHKKMWKTARWGVIIFSLIHFLLEVMIGNKIAGLPVMINYSISAWYIERQIAKGKEMKYLFFMGLSVSFVVFLIRIVLGNVFTLLMIK